MYDKLKDFFTANDAYMTIIGLFIGVVGILLAFIFYFKSVKNKRANYYLRSFNLLNDKVSDLERLEVYYDGSKIKRLTATKIAFWNSGDLTIDRADVVKLDPIKLSCNSDEIQIYGIEVISQSDLSNNFSIIPQEDLSYILDFDYVDKNHGCVIKILHTGLNSGDIKISGKIKGIGNIERRMNIGATNFEQRFKRDSSKNILPNSIIILTLKTGWVVYLIFSFIALYYTFFRSWGFIFAAFFCFFASYTMYPRKVLPKNLHTIFTSE